MRGFACARFRAIFGGALVLAVLGMTRPVLAQTDVTTGRISGTVKDADGGALTYTVTGAPAGVVLLSSGFLYWVTPVKGSYAMTVTVHDNKGATAAAVIKLIFS